MFRDENQNFSTESSSNNPLLLEKQESTIPQDLKEIYKQEGGGKRGAKYRMYLEDGFEPEAAWYFSGPEYREKMKRHDNETRLGIKYCSTCDQALPAQGEEGNKLDEETEKQIEELIAEYTASEPRRNSMWIFNMFLSDGYTIDQAMYLCGPEWGAIVKRRKAEEQLGIKRCLGCEQYISKPD